MAKPKTLEELKIQEANWVKLLADGSLKRQRKRYIKRTLERVRKQIKEKENETNSA